VRNGQGEEGEVVVKEGEVVVEEGEDGGAGVGMGGEGRVRAGCEWGGWEAHVFSCVRNLQVRHEYNSADFPHRTAPRGPQ